MSWTHHFDEDVAKQYGVPQAIIIEHLRYWIRKNRAEDLVEKKTSRHYKEGRWWTFNSVRAWSELLPFWTEKQIAYILGKLTEQKVIQTGIFNEAGYDRTLWYAFCDEQRWILQDSEVHLTKKGNGLPENGEPIPSSLPTNYTDNTLGADAPPILKLVESAQKAEKRVAKQSEIRSFTDYYQSLFQTDYGGAKPTWDGKIMKLVKADIARLGGTLLKELTWLFFEYPPAFVEERATGMGYNIFHSVLDSLLEKKRRFDGARDRESGPGGDQIRARHG